MAGLIPDSFIEELLGRVVDPLGKPLDGNNDGTTGDDYMGQFTVTSSGGRVVSIPDMARGASQSVNVPNTASGLPIRVDNAGGVTLRP